MPVYSIIMPIRSVAIIAGNGVMPAASRDVNSNSTIPSVSAINRDSKLKYRFRYIIKNPNAMPTAAGISISSMRNAPEPSINPVWDVSRVKNEE